MSEHVGRVEPDATPVVVGLDPVATTVAEADHLAEVLGEVMRSRGPDAVVSTHLVPGPGGASARVALTVRWWPPAPDDEPTEAVIRELCAALVPETGAHDPGEIGVCVGERRGGFPVLADSAAGAAREAAEGTGGRAVVFPGRDRLVGTVTVEDVVGLSVIDEVVGIAGVDVPAGTLVRTRDHVRPVWRAGRLVLPVQPAEGGTVVGYESPSPTPCCADHA